MSSKREREIEIDSDNSDNNNKCLRSSQMISQISSETTAQQLSSASSLLESCVSLNSQESSCSFSSTNSSSSNGSSSSSGSSTSSSESASVMSITNEQMLEQIRKLIEPFETKIMTDYINMVGSNVFVNPAKTVELIWYPATRFVVRFVSDCIPLDEKPDLLKGIADGYIENLDERPNDLRRWLSIPLIELIKSCHRFGHNCGFHEHIFRTVLFDIFDCKCSELAEIRAHDHESCVHPILMMLPRSTFLQGYQDQTNEMNEEEDYFHVKNIASGQLMLSMDPNDYCDKDHHRYYSDERSKEICWRSKNIIRDNIIHALKSDPQYAELEKEPKDIVESGPDFQQSVYDQFRMNFNDEGVTLENIFDHVQMPCHEFGKFSIDGSFLGDEADDDDETYERPKFCFCNPKTFNSERLSSNSQTAIDSLKKLKETTIKRVADDMKRMVPLFYIRQVLFPLYTTVNPRQHSHLEYIPLAQSPGYAPEQKRISAAFRETELWFPNNFALHTFARDITFARDRFRCFDEIVNKHPCWEPKSGLSHFKILLHALHDHLCYLTYNLRNYKLQI